MQARIVATARPLVVGLDWQHIRIGPSAGRSNVMELIRKDQSVKVHVPKGASVVGILRTVELGEQALPRKVWSAAAMFASLSNLPAKCVLLLPLPGANDGPPTEAAVIAVNQGQPLPGHDRIVPLADGRAAVKAATQALEDGQVEVTPVTLFGDELDAHKLTWADIAELGTAEALTVPKAPVKNLPAKIAGALMVATLYPAYLGWEQWQASQAKLVKAPPIDPNVAYRASASAAMASTRALTNARVQEVAQRAARMPLAIGGFALDSGAGIACTATARCTATYRRSQSATFADFDAALPQRMFAQVSYGIDGATVTVAQQLEDAAMKPPALDALWLENDLPRKLWPRLQGLETLPAASALSNPASQVVGALPPGTTEQNLQFVVRAWPIRIDLPAWALDALPDLPGLAWESVTIKLTSPATATLQGKIYARRNS